MVFLKGGNEYLLESLHGLKGDTESRAPKSHFLAIGKGVSLYTQLLKEIFRAIFFVWVPFYCALAQILQFILPFNLL